MGRAIRMRCVVLASLLLGSGCAPGTPDEEHEERAAQTPLHATAPELQAAPGEIPTASSIGPGTPSLLWSQQAKLVAPNGPTIHSVGRIVALDGDIALAATQDANQQAGCVYVFVRGPAGWSYETSIVPADNHSYSHFGRAMVFKGNTAVITNDPSLPQGELPGAYVFVRSNAGVWTQQAKLFGSGQYLYDNYGHSATIDGDTIFVGAPSHAAVGVGYVFTRTGNVWTQQAQLGPLAGQNNFGFGAALEGDTLIINGAPSLMYTRSNGAWTLSPTMLPSGAGALSGNTLLLGAPNTEVNLQPLAGSALVLVNDGQTWSQEAQLFPSDSAARRAFGSSVSLQGDTALIGAPGSFFDNQNWGSEGAAYVFTRSNGVWTQIQKLSPADLELDKRMGESVSLSGETALLGAPGDGGVGAQIGAAYAFMIGACSNAAQCDSGFCVDGVCCDTACGGGALSDCQACSKAAGALVNGVCGPIVAGWTCRAAQGPCDVAETCNGASTACPTDAFASGTVCRAAQGPCDVAETCNGASTACPMNAVAPPGTVCRAAQGPCDVAEKCDGASTACPANAVAPQGAVCRPAQGPCDVAETCNGLVGSCPLNKVAPSGTLCRAAQDKCDVAETCDGASDACPDDAVAPAGAVCRAVQGPCDAAETCDGASDACPGDALKSGEPCRPSAGPCDQEELCAGDSPECPLDVFKQPSFVCRPVVGTCDVEETCTGATAACPPDVVFPTGIPCRATAGPCDQQEVCDGLSGACPDDLFHGPEKECRPSQGLCDPAEMCAGDGPACPANTLSGTDVVCRPSEGECDVEERCAGAVTCPPDDMSPPGTSCRPAAGSCDQEERCTGLQKACPADDLVKAGVECRPAQGECDAPEACDGVGVACPEDTTSPDGSTCSGGLCAAGVCSGGDTETSVEESKPADGCACASAPGRDGTSGGPALLVAALLLGALRRRRGLAGTLGLAWMLGCATPTGISGGGFNAGGTTSAGTAGTSGPTGGHAGAGGGGSGECAPGEVQPCYNGPNGTEGVGACKAGYRQCLNDGTQWTSCIDEVTPLQESCETPIDDDCDGLVNEAGTACVCLPGEMASCYSGPPETIGVGVCSAGVQVCNAEGLGFGPCVGEKVPAPETCKDLLDEDCDGHVNEEGPECLCVPGTSVSCYTGPAGSEGVGACEHGTSVCGVDGKTYGPCLGEVTPAPETCASLLDEDCDGLVNEEGAGCVCVPGTSVSCYTGPPGTAGVGDCKEGVKKCALDGLGYGVCFGQVLPAPETCATSGDEDCDGFANEEGAGCLCVPGAVAACYSGPPGTVGVGACKAGSMTCLPGGIGYGACSGEVDPAPETCVTPGDEDCDGFANEEGAACVCAPGTAIACYSGPAGTGGVGACKSGLAACLPSGLGYAPCAGEVTPTFETCATPGDEDCDGLSNEEGAACVCVPGSVAPCYSGPPGTAGVGTCAAGSAVCAADGLGYGTCAGQVLPSCDSCGTAADEDCDGAPDACAPGIDIWRRRAGDTFSPQIAHRVAVLPSGDIIVAGTFEGTMDLGSGPVTGWGNGDIFVARLDSATGTALWTKRFGDGNLQSLAGMALTAAGDIVVFGKFTGWIDLGGGQLATQAGQPHLFLARLDPDGNHVWSKQLAAETPTDVAITSTDEIVIIGESPVAVDLGGGMLPTGSYGFVAGFDPAGNHVWSHRLAGTGPGAVTSIASDAQGGVVLTGKFPGSLDLGGGVLVTAGGFDIFAVNLDGAGNHVWSNRYGGLGDDKATDLALDPNGRVLITGTLSGTSNFGLGALTSTSDDILVLVLDALGAVQISEIFGNSGHQYGGRIASDTQGNIFLAPMLYDSATFGSTTLTATFDPDTIVVKLNPVGVPVWAHNFGGPGGSYTDELTVDSAGSPLIVGAFTGFMGFCPQLGQVVPGDTDLFIAKLAP